MGKLFDKIRKGVFNENYCVSDHALDSLYGRKVMVWQLAAGLEHGKLFEERPRTQPNPSVVVRQWLPNGEEAEVVCSWQSALKRAKLVTAISRNQYEKAN